MDKFEYRPSTFGADTVNMDGDNGFVGTAENVRSRQWARELGKSNLLSAARVAREVDVDFKCDFAVADKLREAADADVLARTPGTFVAQGEWSQRGYILESRPKGIHFGWLDTSLTIALLDGAWWRLQELEFLPEVDISGTKVYHSETGKSVRTYGAAETGLHSLTIYGESVQVGTPTPDAPVPIYVVEPGNLLPQEYTTATVRDVVGTVNSDKSVTLNGTVTGGSMYWTIYGSSLTALPSWLKAGGSYWKNGFRAYFYNSGNTLISTINESVTSFTVPSDAAYAWLAIFGSVGTVFDHQTIYPILCEGSTAIPYSPHGYIGLNCCGTQTTIDLNGNFLASLPDGTRDELTIDSTGAVTLTKRVGRSVYDGDGTETWAKSNYVYHHSESNALYGKYPLLTDQYEYKLITATGNAGQTGRSDHLNDTVRFSRADLSTADGFKATLAASPVTAYYPLATEQAITLTSITMPDTSDGGTVEVAAAVVPTITAEWEMAQHVNLDFPHDYSYDYTAPTTAAQVDTGHLMPCTPRIVFYGAVTDPQIIIAGNKYKVTGSVPAGGRIEIDGRDKTVIQVTSGGTVTNKFADALRGSGEGGGEYIFEPIPPGNHSITWDGTFGVDVGWYEEVGEPPWSLS